MGEKRNAYRLMVGKSEGRRPLGKLKCRGVDDIKICLGEIGFGGMDWIDREYICLVITSSTISPIPALNHPVTMLLYHGILLCITYLFLLVIIHPMQLALKPLKVLNMLRFITVKRNKRNYPSP
jgi:hypothetical protein